LIDSLDHSDPATVTVTRISNPLVGGVGEDFFIPRNWDEQVNGSDGQDILIAQNNGNYHLNGGDGNDILFGGLSGHFSHLNGGAGDDILYAGGSNGTTEMTGGAGADTFVFKDYSFGWNIGSITDYNSSEGDRVDISDLLQGYNSNTPVSNWVKFENGHLSVNQDGVGSDFVTIVSFTNHPDHLQVLLNATQAPVTV
jgi:Ca2+-binding RTX toxin-like protein